MRRTLALVAFALAAFVVTPALAAPGGGPGQRGPDRARPGYCAPPVYTPAPVYTSPAARPMPVINRAKLIQADRIKARYSVDRARLVRSLRVAASRLDRLASSRFVSRGQLRQAERRVANLERQLVRLDVNYQARLARILTPRQVRYFLRLG